MAKPPTMPFSAAETDALLFGLSLVAQWEQDEDTEALCKHLGIKIAAMLPPGMDAAELKNLRAAIGSSSPHGPAIEMALRHDRKIEIGYRDKSDAASQRIVWPLCITFFGAAALTAWCEMRKNYRHFRLDRMISARCLDECLPRSRRLMLAEWRATMDPEW